MRRDFVKVGTLLTPQLVGALIGALATPGIGALLMRKRKGESTLSYLLKLLGLAAAGGGAGYLGGRYGPDVYDRLRELFGREAAEAAEEAPAAEAPAVETPQPEWLAAREQPPSEHRLPTLAERLDQQALAPHERTDPFEDFEALEERRRAEMPERKRRYHTEERHLPPDLKLGPPADPIEELAERFRADVASDVGALAEEGAIPLATGAAAADGKVLRAMGRATWEGLRKVLAGERPATPAEKKVLRAMGRATREGLRKVWNELEYANPFTDLPGALRKHLAREKPGQYDSIDLPGSLEDIGVQPSPWE